MHRLVHEHTRALAHTEVTRTMAQLNGKSIRVEITHLELVADDESIVAMFDRTEHGFVMALREPTASRWGTPIARFTVRSQDASVLALLVQGSDGQYSRSAIDEVPSETFQPHAPEPPKEPEQDCSPIAVADKRIAAAMTEMELDHGRGLHTTWLDACPACRAQRSKFETGSEEGTL
jgi:hypothetical protein